MNIDEKIKKIENMNIRTGIHILQNKNVDNPNRIYQTFNDNFFDTHLDKNHEHYNIKKSNAFIEYVHKYNIKMDLNENLYRLYTD